MLILKAYEVANSRSEETRASAPVCTDLRKSLGCYNNVGNLELLSLFCGPTQRPA